MRLIVPGALPSISTSRGWTTTASAIIGSVTAIRVMSKSVASTVDRPAGEVNGLDVSRWLLRRTRTAPAVRSTSAPATQARTIAIERS
jgi:hypothetical protein